jgi:hypothetical protein
MTQIMDAPSGLRAHMPTQAQPQYQITDSDRKRIEKIQKAWQAYNDELQKPLTPMPGEADDNVMSNRIQPVVDAGVDFLFGKEIDMSYEEGTPQEDQDFLNDTWGRKEQRIPLLQEWAMNGALAGEAFLRIVPEDDGTYSLVDLDPSTIYVKTAPQDCKRILLYCIQYSEPISVNGRAAQEMFYREEIVANYPQAVNGRQARKPTSWSIQHWTQVGQTGMQPKLTGWQAAGEPIDWPYAFAPIFPNQNLPNPNEFWGKPDVTPGLIGLNEALNLVNSCANRVLKIFGSPILWGHGFAESALALRPGHIINVHSEQGKIEAVALHADIPSAIQFAADIRSDIDELSHVPGVATGRIATMPRGALSGVAIELLFMPLSKKTDTKQCTYGATVIDVSQALLELDHRNPKVKITLAWQSAIPHDDLQALQAAVLKKQIGVSDTTIQREQGYDPEEELALSQAEDAQKVAAMVAQNMPPLANQVIVPGQEPMPPPQQGGQPSRA